jgi:hypothetical protein
MYKRHVVFFSLLLFWQGGEDDFLIGVDEERPCSVSADGVLEQNVSATEKFKCYAHYFGRSFFLVSEKMSWEVRRVWPIISSRLTGTYLQPSFIGGDGDW